MYAQSHRPLPYIKMNFSSPYKIIARMNEIPIFMVQVKKNEMFVSLLRSRPQNQYVDTGRGNIQNKTRNAQYWSI